MSILINGLVHDGNCYMCLFAADDGKCIVTGNDYLLSECPIVNLPEHHGRLIDADAFEDAFIRYYLKQERKGNLVFAAVEIKQHLADMMGDWPTIVEAEGGGEDGETV